MKVSARFVALAAAALLALSAPSEAVQMRSLVGQSGQRCGTQAQGAACPTGTCCSKWGFCGTLSFHCDAAKGCQSQCTAVSEESTAPRPVVPNESAEGVQIIVKTISNAVPLVSGPMESSEASAAAANTAARLGESSVTTQASMPAVAPFTATSAAVLPPPVLPTPSAAASDAGSASNPLAALPSAAQDLLANQAAAAAPGGLIGQSSGTITEQANKEAARIIADAKAAAQTILDSQQRDNSRYYSKFGLMKDINVLEREGY